jgi:hypothetical protein
MCLDNKESKEGKEEGRKGGSIVFTAFILFQR